MSLQKILLAYEPKPQNLLKVLKEIQKENEYVGRKEMKLIAEYFSLPLARVFSTASFFDGIKLAKNGKISIKLCHGAACFSQKSGKIRKQLESFLGTEFGSDAHAKFKLEFMSCRGLCDRGPVLMVEENVFEKVTPESVDEVIKNYL